KATRIQLRGEVAQDRVGVVVVVIDQGCKIALGVEHGAPLVGWEWRPRCSPCQLAVRASLYFIVYHVCDDLATANGGWTEAPIPIYSTEYNVDMIWSCRYGDRDPGAHHLRGGVRWLRDFAGIRGFQGRAGDDPAVGQPGRCVDHDPARADQQGTADPFRRSESALCLSARFL